MPHRRVERKKPEPGKKKQTKKLELEKIPRTKNRRLMEKLRRKVQNPIEHKTLLFIFIKQKNIRMNEQKI